MNSYDVVFLKDKSPRFSCNLKRTSICMSYNKTFNHLAVRERSWILTKSPGMVHLPHLIKMVKICLFRRMRFVINLQMLRRVSLRMRFILDLSFLNMQLVHTFRIPPPMKSGRNFLLVLRMPYLLEKGRGIPGPIPLRKRGRDLSPK